MSSISFTFQPFGPAQAKSIGFLYQAAHSQKGVESKSDGPDPDSKIKAYKDLAKHNELYVIMAQQQVGPDLFKPQGFACFEKQDDTYILHDIGTISPKGAGVGGCLMYQLFQAAAKDKIKKVCLTATETSCTFYDQLFFETKDITENGINMENSNVEETAELLGVYSKPRI
jgi:hypothetical protein